MTLHNILNMINGKEIKKIGGKTWYKAYDKLIKTISMLGELTNIDFGNIVAYIDSIDTNETLY